MPVIHDFEYHKPDTLNDAVNLLNKYGNTSKILAGGTDLAVKIKENIEAPKALIDIKGIKELGNIEKIDNKIFIGANVTFSQILDSELIKSDLFLLWEASRTVASIGIRNRATVVGNICSAVPSLDSGPPLLVYNAKVNLVSSKGKRSLDINEWFIEPKKTAIKDNEIVVNIEIPLPNKPNGSCYIKLGRYSGEDLAQAATGILVESNNNYKIAYCAVAPIPKRIIKIEELLKGKALSEDLIKKAKDILVNEISPITDIRATKEYRLHISGIMLERGLSIADRRCKGEKIEPFNYLGG